MTNTTAAATLPLYSVVEYHGSMTEYHGRVLYVGPDPRRPGMHQFRPAWWPWKQDVISARRESLTFVRRLTLDEREDLVRGILDADGRLALVD